MKLVIFFVCFSVISFASTYQCDVAYDSYPKDKFTYNTSDLLVKHYSEFTMTLDKMIPDKLNIIQVKHRDGHLVNSIFVPGAGIFSVEYLDKIGSELNIICRLDSK